MLRADCLVLQIGSAAFGCRELIYSLQVGISFSSSSPSRIASQMEPISRLFTDRSTTLHGQRWGLQVVNLGPFRLPSGVLAASDGFYPEPHRSGETLPTEAGVLELAIAIRDDGDEQVIAARVR